MDVYPRLIMLLGIDHGGNIKNIVPHLSLLGLEEIVELKKAHHLTGSIVEFDENDALIFQEFAIVVVLFFA